MKLGNTKKRLFVVCPETVYETDAMYQHHLLLGMEKQKKWWNGHNAGGKMCKLASCLLGAIVAFPFIVWLFVAAAAFIVSSPPLLCHFRLHSVKGWMFFQWFFFGILLFMTTLVHKLYLVVGRMGKEKSEHHS